MTRRAKQSAEHRDAVADAEKVAEKPSTGTKRARKDARPWVVEYCAQKNAKKVQFLFKHDGMWHRYSYHTYETKQAAESAMRTFKLQRESLTKFSKGTFEINLQWRVRDMREEKGE